MLQPQSLTQNAKQFPGLNLPGIEGTVLATIINPKCEDVLKIDVASLPQRNTEFRSLYKALKRGSGRTFILECKKSSPTLGDFCKDFSLDRLISCYEGHAAAISVLCEEHFFKGSLEYLRYVREHTTLPVICKDFIICKEQLLAACSAGADAVLLMLQLLTKERFLELYTFAKELGLEVLCEVDTEDDAKFASSHNLPVIGINNRDLRILKIDLNNAKKLYPMLPKESAVVSESGISSYQDLRFLAPIKSFLIGSSLSGAPDVFYAANTMLYGINKICGIKTQEALDAAIKGHAAIAGLIFAKKSPRFVDPEKAKALVRRGHPKIAFAAVVVDEKVEDLIKLVHETEVDFLQLHGHESVDDIRKLRETLPDTKLIKAICIRSEDDFKLYEQYVKEVDLIILDSNAPGSGSSFDWSAIPDFIDRSKTLLSGGIGLHNIEKALSCGFAGLDMNSALEKDNGLKDPSLIEQALDTIKEYI